MTSAKYFNAISLLVTRSHSWSLVVTRGLLVVTRGHSCVLLDTILCFRKCGKFLTGIPNLGRNLQNRRINLKTSNFQKYWLWVTEHGCKTERIIDKKLFQKSKQHKKKTVRCRLRRRDNCSTVSRWNVQPHTQCFVLEIQIREPCTGLEEKA